MSRRSSCSSSVSSIPSTISMRDDDPLLRDCFELRKRLQETERSLNTLQQPRDRSKSPAVNNSSPRNNNNEIVSPDNTRLARKPCNIITPENAPLKVHLLGDERMAVNSTPRRPFSKPYCSESEISTNQEQEESKPISNEPDNDMHSSMWKKLLSLRDENSQLFSQNNRLMSELENNCFQMHDLKSQLQDAHSNASNAKKKSMLVTTQMDALRGSYNSAQNIIREKDASINELVQELDEMKKELKMVDENAMELRGCNSEMKEDLKRLNIELHDTVRDLEVLQHQRDEHLISYEKIKTNMGSEIEKLCAQLDEMTDEREEFLETLNNEQKKVMDYQRRERAMKEDFAKSESQVQQQSHQIVSLSTTVSRQTEALSQLRLKLDTAKDGSLGDTLLLKQTIADQRERIEDYQTEVDMTKAHVTRLETLVHDLHEQSISDRLASFSINKPASDPDDSLFGLQLSPRATLANLKLKLATKDAEIQKLQASLTSQSALNQQEMAGLIGDKKEGADGLRSDLSVVIEKCRSSDHKRQELEQMIGRCEDDASRASSQITELENRLANKMALVSSLEHKLGNKNAQLTEIQHEMNKKDKEISSIEEQLRSASSERVSFDKKERHWKDQLVEIQEGLNARDDETKRLKSMISDKEDVLKSRETSLHHIKELHVEQCDEMTIQIEQLQLRCEQKDKTIEECNQVNQGLQLQLKSNDSKLNSNKKELEEVKNNLQTKSAQANAHEEKLTILENQTAEGTNRVASLKEALNDCQKELSDFILKFENEKNIYESVLREKNAKLIDQESRLEELQNDTSRGSLVVNELKDAILDRQDMLTESQQRITELETTQQSLENELKIEKENIIKLKTSFENDLSHLRGSLKDAGLELEQRTKQIKELDEALQTLTTECRHLRENETASKSIIDGLKQTLSRQAIELLEIKQEIEVNVKLISELREENNELKKDVNNKDENTNKLNLKFTEEVGSAQTELKITMTKLSELEKILEIKTEELQSKDTKLSRLDEMLSDSQDEARESELRLEQMDERLRDNQMELRQRATQVTQMEMSFKEQQSELNQKVVMLKEELEQSQRQLSHVATETSEFESRLESKSRSLNQQESLVETLEQSLSKQDRLLDESTQHLKQLHMENESMKSELRELGFVKQELGVTMVKVQAMHDEHQQLLKQCQVSQRNEEEMTRELDDLHTLLAAKETDCHRLARELGASQVREAQLEVRYQDEARNLKHQHSFKVSQMENELEKIHEQENDDSASHQKKITHLNMTITSLKDDVRLRESDCQRGDSRVAELEQEVKTLTRELQLQRKRTHEINESLVIKQSEVARLEAKLSGFERATFNHNRQKKHSTSLSPSHQFSQQHTRPASASGRYEFNLINDQKTNPDNGFNKLTDQEKANIPYLKKGLQPRHRSNSISSVTSLENVEGLLKRAALELDRQVNDSDTVSVSNCELSLSFLNNSALS